jgi:hypothetical protein
LAVPELEDGVRSFRLTWLLAVRDDPTVPAIEKLAAHTLATRMNRNGGSCFPSIPTLAREMGCSERTAQRAIWGDPRRSRSGLVAQGYLHVLVGLGKNGANEYQAIVPDRNPVPGSPPTVGQQTPSQGHENPVPGTGELVSELDKEPVTPCGSRDGSHTGSAAKELTTFYVSRSRAAGSEAPRSYVNKLAGIVIGLLDAGASFEEIRGGISILASKGLDPAALAGCVHEVRVRGVRLTGADIAATIDWSQVGAS